MMRTEMRSAIGVWVPEWLPDDTEESVVGTEWHQEAISALDTTLRTVARRRGVPWGVCEQIEIKGLRRPGGRRAPIRPDVMVLRQPLAGTRSSIPITEAGAPLFIAEIASKTTVRNDREGKKTLYASMGVPEYIIFDTASQVLGVALEAWRLDPAVPGVYQPWLPASDGWWQSTALDISLRPEQPFLEVRDRDGMLLLRPGDAQERVVDLEERVVNLEELLRQMQREHDERHDAEGED